MTYLATTMPKKQDYKHTYATSSHIYHINAVFGSDTASWTISFPWTEKLVSILTKLVKHDSTNTDVLLPKNPQFTLLAEPGKVRAKMHRYSKHSLSNGKHASTRK